MFDGQDSFGGTNGLGGQGVGWSGWPGATTDARGTVGSQPWAMADGGDGDGAPAAGSFVNQAVQSTTGTVQRIVAWPAAHQAMFFGGVLLIVVGWYLHHKGMLE